MLRPDLTPLSIMFRKFDILHMEATWHDAIISFKTDSSWNKFIVLQIQFFYFLTDILIHTLQKLKYFIFLLSLFYYLLL